MAKSNVVNPKISEWGGWNCDWFKGYPDELIAAGLIKPGQFPGDPGQRKTTSRFVNDEGRKCGAQLSGRIVRVRVYWTPEERVIADLRLQIEIFTRSRSGVAVWDKFQQRKTQRLEDKLRGIDADAFGRFMVAVRGKGAP